MDRPPEGNVMTSPEAAEPDSAGAPAPGVSLDRRRLLRGGVGTAPVLLTVVSRPVSAGACTTASAFTSLNLSRDNRIYNCLGRTPGYWKQEQKFYDWPSPYVPSTTAVAPGGANPGYTPPAGQSATLFNDKSAFYGALSYSGMTLLQVLGIEGNDTGRDAVARHVVAALLNAAKGYTPLTVLSVARIKAVWRSFETKGYYEPSAGIRWYADYSVPANANSGGLIAWLKTTMPV